MSLEETAVTATCVFSHYGRPAPAATAVVSYECSLKHNQHTDRPVCDYHLAVLQAKQLQCLTDGKSMVLLETRPL